MASDKGESHSNDEAAKVIVLDELRKADTLCVQTERSKYRFSVSDPSSRRGTLTGGVLGDKFQDAFLSGTMSMDRTDFYSRELKTGARAVFLLDSKNKVERLITSVITDLALARACVGKTLHLK